MKTPDTLAAEKDDPAVPQKIRRSRTYSSPYRLVYGAALLLLSLIALLGFVWFTGALLLTGERSKGFVALGLLGLFCLCRLLAFLNNEKLLCNLCHGTVLHERRCRKHVNAFRIPGLSYRAATVVSVLCTGGFRCMYCGTSYRLRK